MPRLTLQFRLLTSKSETLGPEFGWVGCRVVMNGLLSCREPPHDSVGEWEWEPSDEEKTGGIDKAVRAVLAFFVEARLFRGRRDRFITNRPYARRIVHLSARRRTIANFLGCMRSETKQGSVVGVCGQLIRPARPGKQLATGLLKVTDIHILVDGNGEDIDRLEALFRWLSGEEPPERTPREESLPGGKPSNSPCSAGTLEPIFQEEDAVPDPALKPSLTDRLVALPRGRVRAAGFSSTGSPIVVTTEEQLLTVWDLSKGRTIRRHIFRVPAECAAVSPNGRLLVVGGRDNAIRLYDLQTGAELHAKTNQRGWVTFAAFSAASDRVSLVIGNDLCAWSLNDQSDDSMVWRKSSRSANCAISTDGKHLFADGPSKSTWHWNLSTKDEPECCTSHLGTVTSLACSSDGRQVVSGGRDGVLRLWGFGIDALPQKGTKSISCVGLSPNGQHAATGDGEGHVVVWSVAAGTEVAHWTQDGAIVAIAFNPNEPCSILSVSNARTMRIRSI